MLDTDDTATLAILTFRVGPYLLGAEAKQIAQLPRTAEQNLLTYENGELDDIRTVDLRPDCNLPPATNEVQSQFLMVDRAGGMVGYKVDQLGDLITVEPGLQRGWNNTSTDDLHVLVVKHMNE